MAALSFSELSPSVDVWRHRPRRPRTQSTAWVSGERSLSAGLVYWFGSIGDGLNNARMERFWSSVQIAQLDHQKWMTQVELANAI